MRLKLKVKADHKDFDKRTVERYALFPKLLDDKYLVWMEKYYVEQTYLILGLRGKWSNSKTWSKKTEQKNMLKVIHGSN